MKRQFRSEHPHRLQLLRSLNPPTLNGIDYLEITSSDQRMLKVVCVHPVAGITAANFRIEGGVRITGIQLAGAININGREITLNVNEAGDFSWYTLVIQNLAVPDDPPAGFDPCLASIRFSFKAQCSSDFDCTNEQKCPPEILNEPLLDYLAKDYGSFRRLMLDRMEQLIPQSRERNPADFTVALIEMLAHVGDQLSYYQDSVSTEAYLGTARQRISLRRHARLLDYAIHDGCNSRVFIALEVKASADGKNLPVHTPFLTRDKDSNAVESTAILEKLPDGSTQVFETLHDLFLQSAHNQIQIHAWSDPNFCLIKGAIAAALVNKPALSLQPGDVLIFEEILSPATGRPEDANRNHRHAVRLLTVEDGIDPMGDVDPATNTAIPVPLKLVTWHEEDALPFPLCVTAEFSVGGAVEVKAISIARGNVVLADHGMSVASVPLIPDMVAEQSTYRPHLRDTGLAFAEPYLHSKVIASLKTAHPVSAYATLKQNSRRAQPANMVLQLDDASLLGNQPLAGSPSWTPQGDLLASDRFAQEFVVETEHDGQAYLRFGDNYFGMAPEPGSRLLASYRIGGGRMSNVGAESITRLVTDDPAIKPYVVTVRNPMPAQGGEDPESADAIKLFAPEAFRTQERAVTEDDYARIAERHPEVQRAAARLRWTGSWYTMCVMVDRRGGKSLDSAFRNEMLQHMERFRLAGYDLDLSEPVFVPLDIELVICVLPGYFAVTVELAILKVLSNKTDEDGAMGFFHPDNFSFGVPLLLSRMIERVMAVKGIASIGVTVFQRLNKVANHEIEDGRITAAPLEILRLDNDPSFPENGRLILTMRGGI